MAQRFAYPQQTIGAKMQLRPTPFQWHFALTKIESVKLSNYILAMCKLRPWGTILVITASTLIQLAADRKQLVT